MKIFLKAINFFFSGYFNLIASTASIIGLFIVLFSDKNAIIVALCALVLFLSLLLIRFFNVTKSFLLQKTEYGYHKFATYVRYSTDDGKHITYELHKYLQCKTIAMDEYVHEFYWTGSQMPVISSHLQNCATLPKAPRGEYDKAILKFFKPISYNDFVVIHVKMDIDDSDQKSSPFCEQAVKEVVQLVNFRVELKHLERNPDAKILKRKINASITGIYDQVGFAKFDPSSRAYEYTIFNPEVGYFYRIEWEK